MKNSYIPETMDLDIFLEENEADEVKEKQLEAELMSQGKPLGKKLILNYKDLKMENHDGVELVKHKKDPDGGFESITCIEVTINKVGYSHLREHNKVGSRSDLRAFITIYGPGFIKQSFFRR